MNNIRTALGIALSLVMFLFFVMPVSASSDPVVIVPDMFTSWPSDNGFVADPVFNTYKNLVDTFVANGYVLNQSLFVFPYDWQASNVASGQALHDKIQQIKTTCGCTLVDVIAHGAGGTVAQQYIDSPAYADDVDQLVLLGTPLLGAPGAYLAYEGGQISFGNPVADGLTQAFLTEEAADANFNNVFDYITLAPVASLSELLPLYNYLYTPGPTPMPYPNGYPENPYLIGLLTNFNDNLIAGNVHLTTVLADDQAVATQSGFVIGPSTQLPKWPHGEPTSTLVDSGDGFTPRVSIDGFASVDQEFHANHFQLPTAAQSYLYTLLSGQSPVTTANAAPSVSSLLYVNLSSGGADMQVTDPSNRHVGKNFPGSGTINQVPGAFYSGSNSASEYAILPNPTSGAYKITTKGTGSYRLSVYCIDALGTAATSTLMTINSGETGTASLTLATGPCAFTVASFPPPAAGDTVAPVITITTPQNGSSYLKTDSVVPAATITDDSPIATTTFKFNNTVVNPALPLPFSSAATGTAKLVVSATDSSGNVGFATSTFTLTAPPPPPPPSIVSCLHALSSNKQNAIQVSGSAKIKGTDCMVQVNSNANPAVDLSGSASVQSTKNCVVGVVKKAGSSSITPTAVNCGVKADPFSSVPKPTVGACTSTNLTIGASQNVTLNPGVFCGGIKVSGSAKVTLNPGVYILKNGPLQVAGSGQVTGNSGVGVFMTGTGTGLDVSGSGTVRLVAPTSGVLKGFVIFLDPASSGALATSQLAGSASLYTEGVVYLPKQEFKLAGSTKTLPSPFTAIIADTINLAGSTMLNLTIPANRSNVPTGL